MNTSGMQAFSGWSHGYAFATNKRSEDEIKQGKNYKMSSWFQASEIGLLGSVIHPFTDKISHPLAAKVASFCCSFAPFLAIPYCSFAAAIKEGKYKEFYEKWGYTCVLPKIIGPKTARIFQFSAEHLGDVVRVALITTSIALLAIGHVYSGGAMLCALTYESIDHLGYVPRKISLFMERKMPLITTGAFLFLGSPFQKCISVMNLTSSLVPFFGNHILYKVDKLFNSIHRYLWKSNIPSFQECENEWRKTGELNFEKIKTILKQKPSQFKINPAHLSKSAIPNELLLEIKDVQLFKTQFEKINWEGKFNLIFLKLKSDDRFIDDLKCINECNPSIQLSDDEIWNYFNQWAKKEGLTVQELAISILQKKIDIFCQALKGEIRVKGSQQDFEEVMSMSYKILPYLVESKLSTVEIEDIFLKLCVEGGDYCARGMKRALSEIIDYIKVQFTELNPDPIENFEQKVLIKLQENRSLIIQRYYNQLIREYEIEDSVGKDIHGFDIYRIRLSLGFYPLTQNERKEIGIASIILLNFVSRFRNKIFENYFSGIESVFKEIGEIHFANYIYNKINTNNLLSPQEKEQLIEMYTDYKDLDAGNKFHRLALVMLGVLKLSAGS